MMRAVLAALRRLVFAQHPAVVPAEAGQKPELSFVAVAQMAVAADCKEGRKTMNTAYEKLCEHLTSKSIGYWSQSEDMSICADFRGQVGTYRVFARIGAEDRLFQVFGNSPVRIPEGARPAIAETVARINFGLMVGKFELDYDEGSLRFQAAQILPADELDDQIIERLIGTTLSMLDNYLPAVLSVIYGNELPKDAVRHVEPRRDASDENPRGDA